ARPQTKRRPLNSELWSGCVYNERMRSTLAKRKLRLTHPFVRSPRRLIRRGAGESRTTLRQSHSSTLRRSFVVTQKTAGALQSYVEERSYHDDRWLLNRIADSPTYAR